MMFEWLYELLNYFLKLETTKCIQKTAKYYFQYIYYLFAYNFALMFDQRAIRLFLSLLLPRKRMTGWDRMMFGLLRSWTVEQTLSSKCWSCTPSSPIWESNHWHPALVTAHQRPLSLSLSHSPRFDDDNPEQYSPHTILPLYAAWSEMETRFSIFKQLVAVLENLN